MKSTCSCGEFPAAPAKILPRVLVIDDEPLVRWALVAGLRHAGFDATAASCPEEAKMLTARHPQPDVVLLDISLWGVDTRRLFEDIRFAAPESRILILAVDGQDVRLSPFDDAEVIRKPFDLNSVVALVGDTLSCPTHRARRAI